MKKLLIFSALIFSVAAFFFIPKTPTATINNHTLNLHLAKTSEDKKIGLSKYKTLPQDFGMIFIFDKPDLYGFWMKDMKFPIDIIFIKNGQIVTIYKNVNPPKNPNDILPAFYPKQPANMVLEINANLSEKYGFKESNKVKINNLN